MRNMIKVSVAVESSEGKKANKTYTFSRLTLAKRFARVVREFEGVEVEDMQEVITHGVTIEDALADILLAKS